MRITNTLTDGAALEELGVRLAAARLRENMTQVQLGRESGTSTNTVRRLEDGEPVGSGRLLRILRALDLLGNLDALAPEPGPTPMELLEREGGRRQRARPTASSEAVAQPWRWGDQPED